MDLFYKAFKKTLQVKARYKAPERATITPEALLKQ